MFLQIPFPHPAILADGPGIPLRQRKVGDIIVARLGIGQIDAHIVILQIKISRNSGDGGLHKNA